MSDFNECDIINTSNCCNAPFIWESDVCGDCKEHADTACSDCEDEHKCTNENKSFKS